MNGLDESFQKLLGRQPSNDEKQELYRVRDALGLGNNDALWLIIMALQFYHEKYNSIPARIEKAAKTATAESAKQAQSEINKAVATLVPSVKKAVETAAAETIHRIQLGKSIITLWVGAIVIGGAIAFGYLTGAGILKLANTAKIPWRYFFNECGWGLGMGIASPGLLFIGFSRAFPTSAVWRWLCAGLGLMGILLMILWNIAPLLKY